MKALTNRYVDCKLYDRDDPAGPFVVTQLAYDPEDPTYTHTLFFLRDDGQWIDEMAQTKLPDEDRLPIFFDSAANAMKVLATLEGPSAIVRVPLTSEDVRQRIANLESGDFKQRVAQTVARYRAGKRP